MVCVPCIFVPLIVFLWSMVKLLINWFWKKPANENNAEEDPVCSLLSSCPCINKNNSMKEEKKIDSNNADNKDITDVSDKKND